MLAEELFAKALRSFETCVLVNNNLCGKSFSSVRSPTTFAERSEVTLVPFFIADFNLLSCELDHFTFKVLKQKKKKITILLQFLAKNVKLFLLLLH